MKYMRLIFTCCYVVKPLNFLKIAIIISFVSQIEAVTVSPSLCPTNKIAPHRRLAVTSYGHQRTFGAFYDLLVNDNVESGSLNNLQEQPQADDPDDCGQIDDYDENDVGSATTESARRQGSTDNRYFFNGFLNFLRPTTINRFSTTYRPLSAYPAITGRPTRPPYWSGGLFGNNPYRPPLHQYPSDYIKPVHEDGQETQATYRPGLVGGPLGHVIGVTQVLPTNPPIETTSMRNYNYINSNRFSMLSAQTINTNRRPRVRKTSEANNGIFGSFVDLLFK